MSTALNSQQTHDWHTAIDAVEEIAANTDNESGSKTHLAAMAQYVRDEPVAVLRLLAVIELQDSAYGVELPPARVGRRAG